MNRGAQIRSVSSSRLRRDSPDPIHLPPPIIRHRRESYSKEPTPEPPNFEIWKTQYTILVSLSSSINIGRAERQIGSRAKEENHWREPTHHKNWFKTRSGTNFWLPSKSSRREHKRRKRGSLFRRRWEPPHAEKGDRPICVVVAVRILWEREIDVLLNFTIFW